MSIPKSIIIQRAPIVIAFFLVLLFSAIGITKLQVTVDVKDFFVEEDQTIINQHIYEETFGRNDFIGVLIESDDVFSSTTLEFIHQLSQVLTREVPYTTTPLSIVHLPMKRNFKFSEQGKLLGTESSIDSIRRTRELDPSLVGLFFSEDHTESFVSINMNIPDSLRRDHVADLGRHIFETLQSLSPPKEIQVTIATPLVYVYRIRSDMMNDLRVVLFWAALVAVVLCFLLFGDFQSFFGALLLVCCTPIIVFGFFGWFGVLVDSSFITVPILLTMGVSVGNAIHLNHFFSIAYAQNMHRRSAATFAIAQVWRPILYTAITTTVAMLSFVFVKVHAIKLVGISSALSILVLFILSMTIFPILISFGPNKYKKSIFPFGLFKPILIDRFLEFILRQSKTITALFIVMSVIGIYGSTLITIDFDMEKMMGNQLPFMKDQIRIKNSDICSNEFVNLTIVADVNAFRSPESVNALEQLESDILKLPLIRRTTSVADVISHVNMSRNGNRSDHFCIPQSKNSLYMCYYQLRRLANETLRHWVTDDYSTVRVYIEMSDFSAKTIQNNIDDIEQLVDLHFPDNKDAFITGTTLQMAQMNQYLTKGLVQSIFIALVMILFVMLICFRSVKLGLIAMIPNLFPVILCGAFVGFCNIPLEFVSMTAGPLILGLAVDDTIHFMSSVRRNILAVQDYNSGLRLAYREVGLAITKTTFILSVTFLLFTVSDVNSTINMGIISCVGIISAYLADIFIVPILVKRIEPFKIEKR